MASRKGQKRAPRASPKPRVTRGAPSNRGQAGKGLPKAYQDALVETVTDLDIVTELLDRRLDQGDIDRILAKLGSGNRDQFTAKLGDLLRKTSALLLVSRRLADSLSLEVLLPRMVELISDFLDAERCTIFLHDPDTGELYTKAAVGLGSELRFPSDQGIAGAVFTSGKPLHIKDAYADPRFNPQVDRRTGFHTRNVLCVPLRHRREDGSEEVVGAVQVLNKRSGDFRREDLRLLDTLNSQAAAAFVNALLHEEIRRARDEELRLLALTTAISEELQLQPLLMRLTRTVAALLEAERATLFVHDRSTDELWSLAGQDEIRFPARTGIAGHVLATGETVNIPDAYADPRFNPEVDQRTGFRTRTILCMPVLNRKGQVIAVTQALNKKGGPFTVIDERRLRAFSSQASIAMENAQLFEEVVQVRNYNEGILEGMNASVLTVDAAGTIVKANSAAVRLLGPAAGQAVKAFFRGSNAWLAGIVAAVQRTGRPYVAMDVELVLEETPAGRRVTSVNLSLLPLPQPKQPLPGCILMLEDITNEKRLKATMARYMSQEVADTLLQRGDATLGGRTQRAAVMFCDIRSFTTLSERLGPQETVKLLNEYFSVMADIVLEHGGVVDKFIGDAIMAVFGVPLAAPDDSDRAVACGIEMLRALVELNARRAAASQEGIAMGIGINSDEVVWGNIGSLKRMDFTVIGDGVNLASRIEGATRLYGAALLVSEPTRVELKRPCTLREVDRIRVRGKSQPVAVFEVLDHLDPAHPGREPRFLDLYAAGLALYRSHDWTRAREAFAAAAALNPADVPCRLHQERCRYFELEPPAADWDGVWDMRQKR